MSLRVRRGVTLSCFILLLLLLVLHVLAALLGVMIETGLWHCEAKGEDMERSKLEQHYYKEQLYHKINMFWLVAIRVMFELRYRSATVVLFMMPFVGLHIYCVN